MSKVAPQSPAKSRLGNTFGLTLSQIRCIQGSFSVMGDQQGEQFLLALLMCDPEFHSRLTADDAAVASTKAFWQQLVNTIQKLHMGGIDIDEELDHVARTLHKTAHVTADDMMVIADLLQSRSRDAVAPLAIKYESTFAVAWEALMKPVFTFLSGNSASVDLAKAAGAVGVSPQTILRLTHSTLGAVVRHLTTDHILSAIPSTSEYTSARNAIAKLDNDAAVHMVSACIQHANDAPTLHQALFRMGLEHRNLGIHQHYSVFYAGTMGAIHRSLRVDYLFVAAAMSRAWRRFLRMFNDRLSMRLGSVRQEIVHSTPPKPEPPSVSRNGTTDASPNNKRILAQATQPQTARKASKGAEEELEVWFKAHCERDGTIKRGVVVNHYLSRTTGLDIDLKECLAAIEKQTSADTMTLPQFINVMLRVSRQ